MIVPMTESIEGAEGKKRCSRADAKMIYKMIKKAFNVAISLVLSSPGRKWLECLCLPLRAAGPW